MHSKLLPGRRATLNCTLFTHRGKQLAFSQDIVSSKAMVDGISLFRLSACCHDPSHIVDVRVLNAVSHSVGARYCNRLFPMLYGSLGTLSDSLCMSFSERNLCLLTIWVCKSLTQPAFLLIR